MCDNPNNHQNKKRHGSALEHGEAHHRDHKKWSRRSFLRTTGLAGGMGMLLGNIPLSASFKSPLSYALNTSINDRILVLVRLKGGNDGLNTFVPLYDYGTYVANRPTLTIPQNQLINLTDEIGMPNDMDQLYPFWQEGKMKVVHSVGYEDQNLSHFRSSDIWASASDADESDTSGWMGRFFMNQYPDYLTNPPEIPPAIKIGSVGDNIFNDTNMLDLSVSVSEPAELEEIAQNGFLYDVSDLPDDCYYGEQVGFLRAVTNSTFIYAQAIYDAYQASTTNADYETYLGNQFAVVARLIKGGLGTKVYMVTIDGFDTHANQISEHPVLLNTLAKSISNFYQDLAAANWDKEVLCMTFSEFGRRIEQNASDGTDHGAAAPMMFFGEGLNGNGFIGDKPDLQNVDPIGNLTHSIDYRQLYATVLERWLCVDPMVIDGVLGEPYDRIEMGLDCIETSNQQPVSNMLAFRHEARYHQNGKIVIHYNLPAEMHVNVTIFDLLGKPVQTLQNGYQMKGEHQTGFLPPNRRIINGVYVYRIQAGGRVFSSTIRLAR